MSKVITAEARITAKDATGQTFDNLAKKIQGVAKAADAFKGMTPLAKTGWGQGFDKELDRLKATAAELQVIQKSWQSFNQTLMSGGPMAASKAMNALDMWKRQTLSNLREVKSATEQADSSTVRYMKNAAKFALAAGGVSLGAYEIGRGARAIGRSAAERQREIVRYGLAGLTPDETRIANAKADEISAKFPSVSRTEALGHIRQLRARLGSFDHAVDNVETMARAQVVLKSLGQGDSSEDLEKLVLGLESQGLGNNPAKFRSYLNAFVKAKSLFPDLRGEDFREYMQRAAASKYGLSDDYLQNVVPTMMQHEGASNFGTMQSSAFSAIVGGRQSKKAQAVMRKYGLIKNGETLDESGFISNPYAWAINRLQPALAKRGIAIDEDHRGDMVKAATQMFSNRKVAEFMTAFLVNRAIVEKDRANLGRAKGTEGAEYAQANDAITAGGALVTQLKDAGTAIINIKPVIDSLNYLADHMSAITSHFDQASFGEKAGILGLGGAGAVGGLLAARAGYQWFTGAAALLPAAAKLEASAALLDAAAAKLSGGGVASTVAGAAAAGSTLAAGLVAGGVGLIGGGLSYAAARSVWGSPGTFRANNGMLGALGGDYAMAAEIARYAQGKYLYDGGDFTLGGDRQFHQFGGPNWIGAKSPVSPFGPGSGFTYQPDAMQYKEVPVSVSGEVQGRFVVEAGSDLLRIVDGIKDMAIKLQQNGPGTNGRTSPDARPGPGGRGGIGSL